MEEREGGISVSSPRKGGCVGGGETLEFKISWQNSAGKEGETEKVVKQQKQKASACRKRMKNKQWRKKYFPLFFASFFLTDARAVLCIPRRLTADGKASSK